MLNACTGQQLSLRARRLQVTSRPRAHTQSHKQTHTHTHTPHASRGSPVALSPPSCASASAVNLVSPVSRPPPRLLVSGYTRKRQHACLQKDLALAALRDSRLSNFGTESESCAAVHRRKRRAEKGSVACQEPSGRRTKIYSFETNILKLVLVLPGGRRHRKPAQIVQAGAAASSLPKSLIIRKPVPCTPQPCVSVLKGVRGGRTCRRE